jgi:hypothetical protein
MKNEELETVVLMMKKSGFVFLFFIIASLSVPAQGLYLDWTPPLLFGGGRAIINGEVAKDYGFLMWTLFGINAGFGPFGNIPLYVAGGSDFIVFEPNDTETSFFSLTSFFWDASFFWRTSFFWKGSLIFYPTPFLELRLSSGYFTPIYEKDSANNKTGGFGWDISVAFSKIDGFIWGDYFSGGSMGVTYFGTACSLKKPNVDVLASSFGVFVKIVFRKKTPKEIAAS